MGSFTTIKPQSTKELWGKTGTGGTFTNLATGEVITKDPVPEAKAAGSKTAGTSGPGQSPAPAKAGPAAVPSSPSSLGRQYQEALGRGVQTAASPSRLLRTEAAPAATKTKKQGSAGTGGPGQSPAPTKAAPAAKSKQQGGTASGLPNQRPAGGTYAQLQNQARQAAADQDVEALARLNAALRQRRAQSGRETAGDRIADRAGNITGAIAAGSVAGYTNAAGVAYNAFNDPDALRRSIQQARKALASGRTSDGKPISDAQRRTLQDAIARQQARIRELEAPDSFTNRAYAVSDQAQRDAARFQESAKEGLGKVGSLLVDAGVSMGQSTLDNALGALTGTGLAPFALRAFGGSAQEARQGGASIDQQLAYGSAQAAKEYVTEKLFGLTGPQRLAGGGSFDDAIEAGIRNVTDRLASTQAGQKVLGGVLTWLASGATEGAEEAIGSVIENTLINPNLRAWAPDDRTAQEKFEEGLYETLVGAVSGLMGGVQNLASYQANPMTARTDTENGPGGTQTGSEAATGPSVGTDTTQGANGVTEASEAQQRQEVGNQLLDLMRQVQRQREAEQQRAAPPVETAPAEATPRDVMEQEIRRLFGTERKGRRINDTELSDQEVDRIGPAYEAGLVGMDARQRLFEVNPEEHIDQRDYYDVGSQKINAFQFDHPQLHPYYAQTARALLDELSISQKGGETIRTGPGYYDFARTRRSVSPEIETLLDEYGLSYGQIETALRAIVEDHGQENFAAAKRVELVLDRMLSEGYRAFDGRPVAADEGYIAEKARIAGSLEEGDGSQAFVNPDAPVNDGLGNANRGFDDLSAAERIYGVLPEGENPVRPDDMPRRTTDENRVSRLARTIKGAEVVPDSFIPTLEQAVLDGKFSYIPHTNEQAAARARETIEYNGWGKALSDFHRDVALGKAGDELTALGIELANNAANAGDAATALDVFIDLQQTVRNAGQAAQAVRMLKQASPAHRLYMIQRSVQSMVDSMNLPEGSVKLDETLLKNYLEADSEAQRDAVIKDIQQSVADQIPSTLLDKWTALRYVNMLGNFRTQTRNVLGNVGMLGVRAAKDRVAAGLEGIYHHFNKDFERTKTFTVSKDLKDAARADYENVADVALGQGKYQEGLSDDAFRRGVEEKRTIFKNKLLEKYRTATNWAMTQGDVIFTRHTYARALAGYLKSHGVTAEQFSSEAWRAQNTAFVDKARMYAIQEAQEATFRDNNVVSDWVSGLGRGKKTPRPVRVLAEGLAPFRKTPANVLVRAEEYSPLGLANTIYEAVQAKRGNATGADVINSLSKSLTGTGLFIAGILLAAGKVPGVRLRGGDDDDDKQRAFDDLTGHQAYSLELPNGYSVTLDWLTPGSMPLFMGVELQDLIEEGDFEWKDLEAALTSIAEPMLQMSMLQGVNDTLDDLKYSEDNLGQLAATLALDYLTQGLTNTLLGQAERTFEDVRQSTYTDKEGNLPTWLQRQVGKASAKTPGWDYHQMPYIDEWGREEETGEPAERAINNFFNPGYVSQVQISSVEKELQRLKDATGSGAVLPSRVEKSLSYTQNDAKGKPVKGPDGKETKVSKNLTADEYVQYARTTGQTRRQVLEQLMDSAGYRKLSDEGKAKAVQAVYEYADGVGKEAVSSWKPSDGHVLFGSRKTMLPPAEYILYKQFADRDGSGSTSQAESALTLMGMDLTNEQRGQAWSAMNNKGETEEARQRKEAKNPFTGAMAREGFDPEEALKFWQIYDGTGTKEDPYTKQEKQTDIMEALGLSSRMEAISLWNLMEKSLE